MILPVNAEISGWRVASYLGSDTFGAAYVVKKGNEFGRLKLVNSDVNPAFDYTQLEGFSSDRLPKLYAAGIYADQSYSITSFVPAAVPLSSMGTIPTIKVLEIINKVAILLTMLHDSGVAHENIQLDSIFWDGDSVFLFDFGRISGVTVTQKNTLWPSEFIGLPDLLETVEDFMRADIACLGATLYYLLVGVPVGNLRKTFRPLPESFYDNVGPNLAASIQDLLNKSLRWLPEDRVDIIGFRFYLGNILRKLAN